MEEGIYTLLSVTQTHPFLLHAVCQSLQRIFQTERSPKFQMHSSQDLANAGLCCKAERSELRRTEGENEKKKDL